MKNERNVRSSRPRRRKLSKQFLTLLSVVLVLSALVGGTVAYLTAQSSKVNNTFTPGVVGCKVVESDGVYFVQNENGNTDAKIRVAVVANWVDDQGNIYYMAPTVGASGTNWNLNQTDGYYYYANSVAGGATTPDSLKVNASGNQPEGYSLQVEILAQAIQAGGGAGWGVDPSAN